MQLRAALDKSPGGVTMPRHHESDHRRPGILKLMAASSCVAALGGGAVFLQRGACAQSSAQASDVITNPADAINVLAFPATGWASSVGTDSNA